MLQTRARNQQHLLLLFASCYPATQPNTTHNRSTFELARVYSDVIGIDLSQTFIDMANRMKGEGQVAYSLKVEGEITQQVVAQLDSAIDAGRCTFLQVSECLGQCWTRGGWGGSDKAQSAAVAVWCRPV